MQTIQKIKAFRIETKGFKTNGIVFSINRAKAKRVAVNSFCEIFNTSVVEALQKITCKRASKYDTLAPFFESGTNYSEEYILTKKKKDFRND
jgi:hypothetical protein